MIPYKAGEAVPFLSHGGVERLRRHAMAFPGRYWDSDFDWRTVLKPNDVRSSNNIQRPRGSLASVLITGTGMADDARNALAVYGSLRDLTPAQAADERLWSYLCHFEAHAYLQQRWLKDSVADTAKAARQIVQRYFGKNRRIRISRNGVARLWWMGHVAHRAFDQNPGIYLEALLSRQDIHANVIERPSLFMNTRFLRATAHRIVDSWYSQDGLLERAPFRTWMRTLNLYGGTRLMDTLDEGALQDLVYTHAEAVLQQARCESDAGNT